MMGKVSVLSRLVFSSIDPCICYKEEKKSAPAQLVGVPNSALCKILAVK